VHLVSITEVAECHCAMTFSLEFKGMNVVHLH
jgi:hypothetical protein